MSWDDSASSYGSTFLDALINEEKQTTLGDVWNLPYDPGTNPSLYIPSNNTPQQVAANEIQGQESFLA